MENIRSKLGIDTLTNNPHQNTEIHNNMNPDITVNPVVNPVINMPNAGTVSNSDQVDIPEEDIKLMRDLAEMNSIQNFVTLTPTVQVTTGDIHKEADVDTMIRRIEELMEREIQQSAEGVYNFG